MAKVLKVHKPEPIPRPPELIDLQITRREALVLIVMSGHVGGTAMEERAVSQEIAEQLCAVLGYGPWTSLRQLDAWTKAKRELGITVPSSMTINRRHA